MNIYDSYTAPRYAGYRFWRYANSAHSFSYLNKLSSKLHAFVLKKAYSFLCAELKSVRTTKKGIGTHKECLLILLGAYRFSGILPGEEIKSAVDKKRNVTCKTFPERQASGRIRLASQGFSQRNSKAVLRTPAHP